MTEGERIARLEATCHAQQLLIDQLYLWAIEGSYVNTSSVNLTQTDLEAMRFAREYGPSRL